jgi:hypothetical protein
MKKLVIVILVSLSCLILNAELDRTKTISISKFTDLKDACCIDVEGSGTDEVMTFYHSKLLDPSRNGEEKPFNK